MKKTYLLIALTLIATQLFSQIVFTYGENQVGKEEFLRAYNKNKTPTTDKEKSLREYLNLYIKFKLKVKAAQQLRFDTLRQLKYDMQNFSSQVEEGYMNDEKSTNALVDEAIKRSQKDIHLIHFYVPLSVSATTADSAKAIKAINVVLENLKKGFTDYSGIANTASDKNVIVTVKDIGYITTFTLPYSIENIVYNLKQQSFSNVYPGKNGLHVFKNVGERESVGKWKIAQILFTVPPDATAQQLKAAEKKADSVYELLKAGADFTTLAKQYSEDRLTAAAGGELPTFGTGKYELNFETQVFALHHDGDISKPFNTNYGYHIIKRLQQQPTPTDKSDETFTSTLKQQIEKDTRSNAAKENFIKEITLKTGYKRNAAVTDAELYRYGDSVMAKNKIGKYPISNKIIFSFSKAITKGTDWLNFVKDYKLNADVYKGESNTALLDKYISTSILDYYRKYLQEYNADFKYQMKEFKEGNMLFEIMEKNVWGKASADSIGLQKYYNAHKQNYLWGESAEIILFNCTDSTQANEAQLALKNGKDWKEIATQSGGKIQSDSGRYELAQLPLPANATIIPGYISTPVVSSGDNTPVFIKVLHLFPENQQRTFSEARGLVINEYQNYLEEKWMDQLKKSYPIKINEPIIKSMLK